MARIKGKGKENLMAEERAPFSFIVWLELLVIGLLVCLSNGFITDGKSIL